MADLLRGPVTAANLTAAAGVTTTVDGWWPCLDITFRTPVPASITKIVAQVRERGTTAPVAETVLTSAEIAAGAAKIVNGVSVGQHLEVRLSPAGAPGLPFQPTPWLEVTTSWDALMAALDGLQVGCVKIVCGVGVPTRTDLPNGSLYIREDVSQLWRYVIEPAALCFVLDVSGYADAGATMARMKTAVVNSLSLIAAGARASLDLAVVACDTAATSIVRRAASPADVADIIEWVEALTEAGSIPFDTAAALTEAKAFYDATDPSLTRRPLALLWAGVTDTTETMASWPTYLAAAVAVRDAMPDVSIYSIVIAGAWGTTYTAPIDNTPDDGLPVALTLDDLEEALIEPFARTATWLLMSDLTSIRLNGVEIEGAARSIDFVGDFEVATDGGHNVTITALGQFVDVVTSQAVSVGHAGSFHNSSGAKVRKASAADDTKPAQCFFRAGFAAGATARCYLPGSVIRGLSGLTPGAIYFLDPATPGAITVTPPITAGQWLQEVGVAASATELVFLPKSGVLL